MSEQVLQVAFLGVIAGYGVQPSVLVQSLGAIGFIVNVMSDLLQILEVGPGKEIQKQILLSRCTMCLNQGGISVIAFFIKQ